MTRNRNNLKRSDSVLALCQKISYSTNSTDRGVIENCLLYKLGSEFVTALLVTSFEVLYKGDADNCKINLLRHVTDVCNVCLKREDRKIAPNDYRCIQQENISTSLIDCIHTNGVLTKAKNTLKITFEKLKCFHVGLVIRAI